MDLSRSNAILRDGGAEAKLAIATADEQIRVSISQYEFIECRIPLFDEPYVRMVAADARMAAMTWRESAALNQKPISTLFAASISLPFPRCESTSTEVCPRFSSSESQLFFWLYISRLCPIKPCPVCLSVSPLVRAGSRSASSFGPVWRWESCVGGLPVEHGDSF